MSVDVRLYTRVIIRKKGRYLQCVDSVLGGLVWSASPWDAWWTRKVDVARDVAIKTGGVPVLFNPVTKRTALL